MYIERYELELTSEEANDCFGRPSSLANDYSLCALFRAIVINHEENPTKDLVAMTRNRIDSVAEIDAFLRLEQPIPLRIIQWVGQFSVAQDFIAQNLKEYLTPECKPRWITFDGDEASGTAKYLNKYLSQFAKSMVFISPEEKAIIVIIDDSASDNAKLTWIQAFESMLWAVMPWYFPEKDEATISFFKKLSVEKKPTSASTERALYALKEYVKQAANKINLRDIRLHKMLDGIADRSRTQQIDSLSTQYDNTSAKIRRYIDELNSLYEALENVTINLEALKNMPPKPDTYIFDFFKSHNNISIISVTGSTILYSVTDTLEFYDHDQLARLFDNPHGWFRGRYGENETKYFRELLLNHRGIVRIHAVFKLSDLKLVSPIRGKSIEYNALPNQHIYQYGCSGGHDSHYVNYATSGDWDMGIEQSICATKNWAVGDSTVSARMFESMLEMSAAFIYVSDGSKISHVTPEMRLVTFNEFKTLVDNKIAEEQRAAAKTSTEGENNG